MAIVLPQGRFNNSSDKQIREFIAERCRILAVVGLHGNVFKPHTGTKTSVLFVQKWDDTLCPKLDDYPIFFATMQEPSKDNSGEKIFVRKRDFPNSPSLKGWQTQSDGVVNTPSLKGWQTQSDGVVNTLSLNDQQTLSDGVETFSPLADLVEDQKIKYRNSINYFSLPYNPALKERARELRKAGNLSEVLFWQQVKNKQFKNLDFDRQKIIGNYIVDFYCSNYNVVIEIDGKSHIGKEEYDELRDEYLTGLGLTVIHISDDRIKKNLKQVMEDLFNHSALSGTPPMEGNNSPSSKGWQTKSDGVVHSPSLKGCPKDGVVISPTDLASDIPNIYQTNPSDLDGYLLDTHGHLIVKHDLFNHDGLTKDGIAEAFAEFAKKEQLSFF